RVDGEEPGPAVLGHVVDRLDAVHRDLLRSGLGEALEGRTIDAHWQEGAAIGDLFGPEIRNPEMCGETVAILGGRLDNGNVTRARSGCSHHSQGQDADAEQNLSHA